MFWQLYKNDEPVGKPNGWAYIQRKYERLTGKLDKDDPTRYAIGKA